MLSGAPMMLPESAAEEAKAYLRIVGEDEDALVARLMLSAAELCERFTGQVLIARSLDDVVPVRAAWTRLGATPVRSIAGVEAQPPGGAAYALAASDYAVDIDANGDGWVRVMTGGVKRVRVSFEAGMAEDWSGVPEALRQGVIRLAAHFYAHRDAADDAGPPAAVTALWRPWRRMRLA